MKFQQGEFGQYFYHRVNRIHAVVKYVPIIYFNIGVLRNLRMVSPLRLLRDVFFFLLIAPTDKTEKTKIVLPLARSSGGMAYLKCVQRHITDVMHMTTVISRYSYQTTRSNISRHILQKIGTNHIVHIVLHVNES